MESNPSERKGGGGGLDLNSDAVATAAEQLETLTSPMELGSGASRTGRGSDGGATEDAAAVGDANVVGERAEEVDADHDDVGNKGSMDDQVAVDVGNAKAVAEASAPGTKTNLVDGGDIEDEGDSAVADASEVKVGIRLEDTVVAYKKSMDKGDDLDEEAGSGEVQAVNVGGQELTATRKRGRPRKSIDTEDAVISSDVGVSVGMETDSGGDKDVIVSKRELTARRKRGRPRRSVVEFQDRFVGSDLVWGKVRSFPWWPGQIVDPSDASEMALNIQKKDHHLVAYFGDKTFAWCDESRLKHFQENFSLLEKQSSMDAFVNAVNAALQEVSRRVELGMTCHCFMDETYACLKDQKVDNAGIREGACCFTDDKFCISFEPRTLVDYIQTLAQFPYGGADRLELAITKSQLKAFYRSKGYAELPAFIFGQGLEEIIEVSPPKKRKSDKDVSDSATPTSSGAACGKGKSRDRGSSPGKERHVFEHGRKKKSLSELMEKNSNHCDADGNINGHGVKSTTDSSYRKCKAADFGPADSGKGKKKKLDSLGDLITKSEASSPKNQLKVGELMRRVAGKLTGSPPMLKSNSKTLTESTSKVSHVKGGVGDAHNQTKTPSKSVSGDCSSPGEMLAQLCLAARDPLKGYSFLSTSVSFFIDFKSWALSSSLEDEKDTGTASGRKGRRKFTTGKSAPLAASTSDCSQESYQTDIVINEEEELVSSEQNEEDESERKRQKQQQYADEPAVSLPLSSMLDVGQHLQDGSTNCNSMKELESERCVGHNLPDGSTNPNNMQELEGERSTSHLQKEDDECMPTALVLTFSEPDDIPAESDLIKIFGQYGPLREAETEVKKLEKHAKVVFKRRSDADIALHSAGKCSIFGPTLVSYRLRSLEAVSRASPSSTLPSK